MDTQPPEKLMEDQDAADALVMAILRRTNSKAVALAACGGIFGDGYAAATQPDSRAKLAVMLRRLADELDTKNEQSKGH